jgi:predicted HTH transcriptional regulator
MGKISWLNLMLSKVPDYKTPNRHNDGINVGVNVGTNEDKVIMLLWQDSNLTAKTIAATLGLTDRQVERILSRLKRKGKIVRHGASKNGYWEVVES